MPAEQPPHPPTGPDGYYQGFPVQERHTPPEHRPAHTGISGRTAGLLVTIVVLVAVVALLNLVQVSQVIYRPGPVFDTLGEHNGEPIISIEGAQTYPTEGTLDFTTVTIAGGPGYPVSAWEWLTTQLDSSTTTVPRDRVFPEDTTAEQIKEQNTALMVDSQKTAAVVALRGMGREVDEQAAVAQVMVGAPAEDVLQVNDRIVAVDGQDITRVDQVSELLQEVEPGEEVPMLVERDGDQVTLEVPTGEGQDEAVAGRTIVGVFLQPQFPDLPFDVTIDAGNVGGPSAGMMFSLAVFDLLTPGDLTGGEQVAGTGTINSDGAVGPIGGIKQKMIGADRAGADYFLAPEGNCEDVNGSEPGDLEVVKVGTFEQARDAMHEIAAGETADLPSC